MTGGKIRKRLLGGVTGVSLALTMLLPGSASGLAVNPGSSNFNWAAAGEKGWSMEQNRSGSWELAQAKKLNAAIASLQSQRKDVMDAYVVSIGLDSDAVFGREATEAAKVLSRRYGAAGRTIVLTAGADMTPTGTPQGSPPFLNMALAAVAAKMDRKQDVLILFATTHGDRQAGLVYSDGDDGFGMVGPKRLAAVLDELGIKRRLVILSACYSGIFLPYLNNDENITITAASADRTSFGCLPSNDWTFFGDALINHALRKPQSLQAATDEAFALISEWEGDHGLTPSNPQIYSGEKVEAWLKVLEARVPKTETAKVGRPSVSTLQ